MNKLYQAYCKWIKADQLFGRSAVNVQMSGQAASDAIRERLLSDKATMISRFGSNELACILNFYFIEKDLPETILNIARGIPYFRKLKPGVINSMEIGAGFFPATEENLRRYVQMSLAELSSIDILGSWLSHEKFLFSHFQDSCLSVRLRDLSPLTNPDPWSSALAGKKVLVVHPFEETIVEQYRKRHSLFKNPAVLPEFDLKTLKSVQSIAGNKTSYSDWFDALQDMKEKISNIDFEIAILGCGAYGMPLAAHIKSIGKKAVHLGGETQILFGIKGKRWEAPSYNYQEKFYNESWVRPKKSEMPSNAGSVESACYW